MNFRFILLSLWGLIAVNCATFTEFNPEVKDVVFKNQNPAKSLLVNVRQRVTINGTLSDVSAKGEENARNRYAYFCRESGLFKEVKTGLDVADMKLLIESDNNGEANRLLAFLSGLTLFLIPAYAQDDLNLNFSFRDKNDTIIKEYKRRVTFNTWIHLILIPLMPFKFPIVEVNDGVESITRSILDEANRDGIFK